MGEYVIPGAVSVSEAMLHRLELNRPGDRWELAAEGIAYRSEAWSNEEAAGRYADFTPVATDTDEVRRLPQELLEHLVHLRDYRQAIRTGQPVTNAQTAHVIADIIDTLRLMLDDRLG